MQETRKFQLFRVETIASFLHSMVLLSKLLFNQSWAVSNANSPFCFIFLKFRWLVIRLSLIVVCGTWACRVGALRRGFYKGSYPLFTRVSEKTTENPERLGRQARPGIEPVSMV